MLKRLICGAAALVLLTGCGGRKSTAVVSHDGKMLELKYAKQFSAEYIDNDCVLITIGEDKYVIVPENGAVPKSAGDAAVIRQPLNNVYNAASSAMDLIDGAGALEFVDMTSTKYDDWSLQNIRDRMDCGDITYIGKYSAPDYEALLEEECSLAIESTMIYHSPEVKEQIEALGIPVLVERSSYEKDPLGRMEWIKLYGLLFGCEEKAEKLFDEKIREIEDILSEEKTGKKAAFFYINSAGGVVVRKPADYVPEMMRMAGGEYIFSNDDLKTDENALSTMTIQPETFYEKAWDADIIFYNSDITGGVDSIDDIIRNYPLLKDFTAVKNGNVWCTEKNIYQQTTGAADMIKEFHSVFKGEADDKMNYMYRLE
ncbi:MULTISPECIES: ABC transporter substrate-binding protein [Ruminococcus]|uniref:Iron complex transport system substrate-binding protein n=1 Tax=Ruminococcus flavefaciens TaxID=1265 RepID=A0A1M7HQ67_RUMFL|nr:MULTISPECIES: ABC transporter substrate-binding protein [Ruminococcus]MCR4796046.1 ABC transporter substrate-binding protein [Ruminococcus sp.]SHM30483.1 iron complex transport system substrate-binding protein [Ruminococcus flavefaciens]